MGSRIQCFWLEPTAFAISGLRRYEKRESYEEASWTCPSNRMKFHDTSVDLGQIDYPLGEFNGYGRDDIPHEDPRWPKVCHVCGTPFKDTDHWQHNVTRLFSGAPDGKLYTLRNCPPGAMYDANWGPMDLGPDGIRLAVALPPEGGDDYWLVDGPSKGGGRWTRTGTVPNITASPSILTPRYHGFLRGGYLEEC